MKCTLLAVNVAILFSCYVGAMDHLKQFLHWESADEKKCHARFEAMRRELIRGDRLRSDRLRSDRLVRDNRLTDFHLVPWDYHRDEPKFHHDEDPELAAATRISLQEMQQKQLPERNQKQNVKECPVCTIEYDADRMIELSCKHNYCIACLTQIIDNALWEKTTAQMLCPDPDCKRPISQQDTRIITNNNRDKFNEIALIMAQERINRQPGFNQCPTADCHYAFLYDGQ